MDGQTAVEAYVQATIAARAEQTSAVLRIETARAQARETAAAEINAIVAAVTATRGAEMTAIARENETATVSAYGTAVVHAMETGAAEAYHTATVQVRAEAATVEAQRMATGAAGGVWVRPQDGMEMVFIAAGEFVMGSSDADKGALPNEKPAHRVYLDGYWIDKYEVTNEQYRQCVAAGACRESGYDRDSRYNGGQQPVVGVRWDDAQSYCRWVGARLPTEAEWEEAARGTDGRIYPWGNEWDASRLNAFDSGDGYEYTAPVGSYPAGASPYSVLDMAGNVAEWVADWYDGNYYSRSPERNPTGPDTGISRVIRGGSWDSQSDFVRSANRLRSDPVGRLAVLGFRCADDHSPESLKPLVPTPGEC